MGVEVDVARAARLIAEPARAAMLEALLSGVALSAGELARAAGVSAATASEHLSRLVAGGLVEVHRTGRHRYHRLAAPEVAHALEALALISPARPVSSLRRARADTALRYVRSCYDHLAGRLGTALHDGLVADGSLAVGGDGYLLTDAGQRRLVAVGVDVVAARAARRAFARSCLDFTERRPHLAGALGAALRQLCLDRGWLVRRAAGHRALRLTDTGRRDLPAAFAIDLPPPD
ncbi:ArsR/SmtB family transcription factor [Plantactinospora siamensis]|uniref:ArsR/SmtB family transcription factor n=1 Tax=Plantactinospora siamensis TaxID=555372 RepID=A0ABV6NY38_9ACTN